ncbi:MAG TPA: discoidin domain-containing protein, partial [Kiritimatiellia bacterium]
VTVSIGWAAAPAGMKATASSGDTDYRAELAIDGNMSTRWSSNFEDDHWWQVEFEKPRTLAGIKLSWETAYGEKYLIQVSDDGASWRDVYRVEQGDGRTDILFFGPVTAKFFRLKGIQRGTGWGYSLWEVNFIDAEQGPRVEAKGENSGAVIDGDRATAWRAKGDGEQAVTLTLPKPMDIGGLELTWGDDYAADYAVQVSPDGKTWTTMREMTDANGATDYIFFPARKAAAIRIECRKSSAGKGYVLAQIELKSGEEQATPLLQVQARGRDSRAGTYPMWLGRQQEFWTIIGLPDDEAESVIGETGAFEPYKGGFTVLPYVLVDGKAATWSDVQLVQSLEDGYLPLPTVGWDGGDWTLQVDAMPGGTVGASGTYVRYRVAPKGGTSFKGQLALAVLPVQMSPVWQNGGFCALKEIRCVPDVDSMSVKINGRTQAIAWTAPSRAGVSMFAQGDAAQRLVNKGAVGPELVGGDEEGLMSAGLVYDLDIAPGTYGDVVLYYPLHPTSAPDELVTEDPSSGFAELHNRQALLWHGLLDRFSIEIPEPRFIRMMKSYLAYILINKDGPWTKPGSRNYAHSWIRDGECTSVAMMRLGLTDQARDYINAYSKFILPSGWVPHLVFEGGQNSTIYAPTGEEGNEYDGIGLYVALIRQYVDFTGDDALLNDKYPVILRVLKFGQGLRRERMTDEYKKPENKAYYGILPRSNSHEGYYPAKHSYWDDYWYLRGLRDGIHLAKRLGKSEDAAWMEEELADFDTCLRASLLAVIERDKLDHIPGCVEKGDFDSTSTAIAISDCEAGDALPQPYGANTFDKYFANFSRRLKPGGAETFTPYEVRTADAYIKLGQRDRALACLRFFSVDSSHPQPWNHLAEVVHANPRAPSYIGDMPHTWVGAGYINAVRSLFAYETGDRLVLAAGVPADWLDAGVTVADLPTQFGTISYTLKRDGDAVVLSVTGEAAPPDGFRVELPTDLQGMAVKVNDKAAGLYDKKIGFERLPAVVRMSSPR